LYIRKAFFVTKLALVLILGYMVVRITLLPERIEKTLAPASALGTYRIETTETTGAPDLSLTDYTQIVERNPFGTSGKITNSHEQTLTPNSFDFARPVPEDLGIALFGTVSGTPEVARAIIKDRKTGAFDLYKIGQIVKDARIESIDMDMVILLHNGQRKILRFDTEKTGNNNNNNTRALFSQAAQKTDNITGTDSLPRDAGPAIQTTIGFVETILKKAVIKPYIVNGRTEGLKITGLENIKAAEGLGLKNGDIIHTVNGHRLTGKQKAYQVFKKARSRPDISFELSRDGKTKKLSFGLR
jgi:type II secretion system protein C